MKHGLDCVVPAWGGAPLPYRLKGIDRYLPLGGSVVVGSVVRLPQMIPRIGHGTGVDSLPRRLRGKGAWQETLNAAYAALGRGLLLPLNRYDLVAGS
jgi:hypothetical protein